MTGPRVVVKTVPGVCVDNLPLRFGSAYDASIVYDGSAEELTFQTKDAAGSLIDRVALRAGINNPSLVVNDPGADMDVRLEGDNDANLLFLDASVDRVGVGTATPGSKLAVNGTFAFTTLGAPADLASQALTNANIDSGAVDGAVVGGSSPAAGTFTALNATGGGALTGTWTNLGSVATIDINAGTVDGAVIGGAAAAAATVTTLAGTDTTDATSTTAAAMKTAGGGAFVKDVRIGVDLYIGAAAAKTRWRAAATNTQSISTTAPILTGSLDFGGLVLVEGQSTSGDRRFFDLLMVSYGAFSVIASNDVYQSPAARTYSLVANVLNLAMASGTYHINTLRFTGDSPT